MGNASVGDVVVQFKTEILRGNLLPCQEISIASWEALIRFRTGNSLLMRMIRYDENTEKILTLVIEHLARTYLVADELKFAWCMIFEFMSIDLDEGGPEDERDLDEWIGWAESYVAETARHKKLAN